MCPSVSAFRTTLAFALVMSASLAFGQIDSNAVTVTASRNANLQPDTVLFGVGVTSGFNVSLDDVVAALAGSGITAANFSSVSSQQGLVFTGPVVPNPPALQPMLQWNFALPVPLAKLKDTATTLSNIQQNIAKKNAGLAMSFSVQGTQVSQQLQQSQPCVVADLIADARVQAQKLADAAGLALGQILGLSSPVSSIAGSNSASLSSFLIGVPFPPSICAVTVKFALIRL
jgi:hypothetical protein